jgi:hypothetical protein
MQRQKMHFTGALARISSIVCVMQKTLMNCGKNLYALHEGTKSEREERYHIALKKINSFEMIPKESANDMYTRLNVLVENLNALGLTQISPSDVARRILSVLPVEKYGHIIIVLHQSDLSIVTPTQVLGKINAHEMYMHITSEEGSSSSKKKDLAFKASHDKKKKKSQAMIVHESSSESDIDDASLALMIKKTTKMLKKLNKSGIKFDGKKKKFFTSSKRKPISEIDCYNCGEVGHLAHQCLSLQKTNTRTRTRARKMNLVMKKFRRRRTSHTRRRMTRRNNITKRRREAKLTLLVIGSPTLSHHVSPPMMRATTRKRRSPHL